MKLKDQNWKNLTANHLQDSYGIGTRYSPQEELKKSFQSLRSCQSNPEKTEIHHTNCYIYAEKNFKEYCC